MAKKANIIVGLDIGTTKTCAVVGELTDQVVATARRGPHEVAAFDRRCVDDEIDLRAEDDALWQRFKAAQDTFFTAKDAVVQAEEDSYRANLAVKEALLADAEAILPVTDLEKAKAALRVIQDKWDKAGKVPRADLERTEKAMRRIEQAVRDAEDRRWSASNPEAAARASSLVEQLEKAVASLEKDLANAQASGNAKKVAEAEAALTARRQWLDQARSGLAEFGGR